MNTPNKVIAAVFAFKEVIDKQVLSVLVFDGENDSFELPTREIALEDRDIRNLIAQMLMVDEERGRIRISEEDLLKVPTNEDYSTVYTTVLSEWPGRPKGTNWINVSSDGSISEELADNHNLIIKEALGVIINTLVAPVFQPHHFSAELQSKLWSTLMPESRRSEWLERVKRFGLESSAFSGLADFASSELKNELSARLSAELEARKNGQTVPKNKCGKFAYDYIHPSLTVDIVVLAVNEKGQLVIPLTKKQGTERGNGLWGLPGGFVTYQDFIDAKWEPGKFNFDKDIKEYRQYVSNGNSVVVVAAHRFIREKAGIDLPGDTQFYQLTSDIQDNPRHGETDGAPIMSRAVLAIVRDYKLFENNAISSPYVQDIHWFPICRRLFQNGKLVIEESGEADKDAPLIEGKKSILFRYDSNKADVYLNNGKLVIDHCQGEFAEREKRGVVVEEMNELLGHHDKVIVEALELIKDKAFRTTLLADFIIKDPEKTAWNCTKNAISFDYFKKVRDAVKCFDPSIRQNLFDKETAKELRIEELREKLSLMNEKELVATAKKKGLGAITAAIKGSSRNEMIDCIIERMKEETYQWKDPTGGIHYLINNGFLVKDPTVSRTYYLSEELYQRFLDLGSTI